MVEGAGLEPTAQPFPPEVLVPSYDYSVVIHGPILIIAPNPVSFSSKIINHSPQTTVSFSENILGVLPEPISMAIYIRGPKNKILGY